MATLASFSVNQRASLISGISICGPDRYSERGYYAPRYDDRRVEAWAARERWEQRREWEERQRWEREQARRYLHYDDRVDGYGYGRY